jgi:hypothetical protein
MELKMLKDELMQLPTEILDELFKNLSKKMVDTFELGQMIFYISGVEPVESIESLLNDLMQVWLAKLEQEVS